MSMSSGLKLKSNGVHQFIESPSGTKITASKLEIGKTYLNRNKIFLRKIINIVDKNVQYLDEPVNWYGTCSKTHFATACPHEATEEEIEFILSQNK